MTARFGIAQADHCSARCEVPTAQVLWVRHFAGRAAGALCPGNAHTRVAKSRVYQRGAPLIKQPEEVEVNQAGSEYQKEMQIQTNQMPNTAYIPSHINRLLITTRSQ
jgi:hypothetical protein